MDLLAAFLFAVAVSADAFGVGVAYGMRQIQVPLVSLAVMAGLSVGFLAAGLAGGYLVAGLLHPNLGHWLGAGILIGLGLWLVAAAWKADGYHLLQVCIPSVGITISVLKEPVRADFDASGVISWREAVTLGLALALDAVGAGLGAALAGLQVWLLPFFAGGLEIVAVAAGLRLGACLADGRRSLYTGYLPGLVLILLGVWQLS